MLDVHPPHGAVHGWRDFFIHLGTITIGLLIALSLEGCVEWQHHRHLVHEAEASLHKEIESNATAVQQTAVDLRRQQQTLEHDVYVLRHVLDTGKLPGDGKMQVDFHISTMDDVSWKTAQTTGALAYMPYATAQENASIYSLQAQMQAAQEVAARDAILSIAPFANSSDPGAVPSKQDAADVIQHIQVLEGQLYLLQSVTKVLDQQYKHFLSVHP